MPAHSNTTQPDEPAPGALADLERETADLEPGLFVYNAGGDDYSAALKSYELLLAPKGYALIGCTLNGSNAFFVRRDLLRDHFVLDTSAECHYEPQRFWLTNGSIGGHGAG